jgi:gluconate:H+ symporter, GntP family
MPVALELAAKSEPWVAHDTRLMVAALAGIALIVILITAAKMHPFLALVLGSALVGIASGVGLGDVITNFEKGVGDTLKEVGLLIALGAMLGKLLAESGGADRIVDTLVTRSGKRMVPWAMALVAHSASWSPFPPSRSADRSSRCSPRAGSPSERRPAAAG